MIPLFEGFKHSRKNKYENHLEVSGISNARAEIKPFLWFFLLVLILPNVPLIALSSHFDLVRPAFNIDYIFAAVVILFGYRTLGTLLLFVFVASDLLALVVQIFPFIRLNDVVYLARFVFLTSWFYILACAAGLIFTAFVGCAFYFITGRSSKNSGLIILNVALAFFVAHVYFGSEDSQGFRKHESEGTLVSSQALNYYEYRSSAFVETAGLPGEALLKVVYQGDAGAWYRLPEESFSDRLLLVVNESWGAPVDPRITQALLSPLLTHGKGLEELAYGDTDFTGATVAGELRELCSLWPNHFNLKPVENGFENCLPNRLRDRGYVTHAMHGAVGLMYDRLFWYPRAGFEGETFYETHDWPSRCVSFPGACDLDMRQEVSDFFEEPGKRFMYWLTLNTHSIYDLRDLRNDTFDCEAVGVETNSVSCRSFKLQAQFFAGLAVMLDDPKMRGVTVRVIGDHMPPIFNLNERLQNFKENKISWIQFTIPNDSAVSVPKIVTK